MPSFRQYAHMLLTVLLVFCQVLHAANFAEEHDPEGPLRVRLDYELATRSNKEFEGGHQWVFSSHITFNEDVGDITDGQLRKIAEDAFQEMESNIMLYEPKWDRKLGRPKMQPGVITILAVRKEIFLSSSQKGTVAFINEVINSPVKDQLELCQALWQDFNINPDKPDHKNGRKCGEMMAFHQYYLEHEEPLQDLDPLARVTTVARVKDRETGESNLRIIPPCGTDEHVSLRGSFSDPRSNSLTTYLAARLGLQSVSVESRWSWSYCEVSTRRDCVGRLCFGEPSRRR